MAEKFGLDYGSIEWDMYGRAKWRHTREVPCTGPPRYSGGCQGRWTDEYGSSGWCSRCNYGGGKMSVVRYIRLPQYDVQKRPRKNWKPPKKVIESAYKQN